MKKYLIIGAIGILFFCSGCKLVESMRSPENRAMAEKIVVLEEKLRIAVAEKRISPEKAAEIWREISGMKDDINGSDSPLWALLGTGLNIGMLLLRHKLPGLNKT